MHLSYLLKKCKLLAEQIFYPQNCLNCETDDNDNPYLCTNCIDNIKIFDTLFCAICKARLPNNKKICHLNSPIICGSATFYEEAVINECIKMLKFKNIRICSKPLSTLLERYLKNINLDIQDYKWIPIPLSKERERQRGFNQSEEILLELSKKIGIKSQNIYKDALVRSRNTRPQTDFKNINERKENVKNCFQINNNFQLLNSKIILIDDVRTSTSTLIEAATCLKNAGVRKIIGLTIAS